MIEWLFLGMGISNAICAFLNWWFWTLNRDFFPAWTCGFAICASLMSFAHAYERLVAA